MNKKKIMILCIYLICFLITACKSQNSSEIPEIKAALTISKLSDKEFDSIGTQGEVKEDFRKVDFLLNVNNCSNIENRKISIPDFKTVMNSYDKNDDRYWFGKYSISDSPKLDAIFTNNIIFLSGNLTNDEIKNVFKNSKIEISWTDKSGKEVNQIIYLTDIIDFKEAQERDEK